MVFKLFRKEIASVHAAAFLIGAAGFLSRILGLLRDRLLASEFGASRSLDIYYASFQIPDFLFTIFLMGAASAAILPTFVEYWKKDKDEARQFIGELLFIFSLAAIVISAGVAIFAPWLVRLVAPGFDEASWGIMTLMTRIMMLSPIFLGVSNIVSSVMQAERKFVIFAMTSIFYNIGIILGIVFFVPAVGITGLAWGVVLGAFLHMGVQIPALHSIGFRLYWRHVRITPAIRKVIALSIPRVVALSLQSILLIFLIALGTRLSAGSIAVFQFSNNLRYIPIGIFGVSYAIAAFGRLSESALARAKDEFYSDFASVAETIFFWIVPIAFLSVVLRAHIVRLTLGAGQFSWGDTRLTAAALAILSFAVIAESLRPLLLRAFYALGNTRIPLYISIFTTLLVAGSAPFLLSLFVDGRASGRFIAALMKVGDIPDVGVLGLVLAFTLGSVIDVLLLWVAFSAESRRFFGVPLPGTVFAAILRTLFAAFLAALMGYGTLYLVSFWISLSTFWGVLGQAAITFIVAAVLYILIMYVLGSAEVRSLLFALKMKPRMPQQILEGEETSHT